VVIFNHASCYPAACVVDGADDRAIFFSAVAFVTVAVLFTAFLRADADFFATADGALAASAFFAAHRFFKAATIAAFPALLSLRFGLAGSFVVGSVSAWIPAHRRCWASFIRLRAAAENLRRLRTGASVVAVVSPAPPGSIAWSSAICWSNLAF
jgi:hypothetical protein